MLKSWLLYSGIFMLQAAFPSTAFPQSAEPDVPQLYTLPSDKAASNKSSDAQEENWAARSAELVPRVVGGQETTHKDWPSLVLVVMLNSKNEPMATCGGTVIASQWVLTAGHCAAAQGAAGFAILEGTSDLGKKGRWIRVSDVVSRDDYSDSPEAHNDVALLHLASAASSPPQVLLSQEAKAAPFAAPATAYIAGFGLTSAQPISGPHEGKTSKHLLQAKLPLVDQKTCARILQQAMGNSMDHVIDDATICAGDIRGGRDSCNGDSGGPLSYELSDRKKVQIGVVSWGPGCAQKNTVGVYASVSHFESWIKSYVKDAVFYNPASNTSFTDGNETSASENSPTIAAVEQAATTAGLSPEINVALFEGSQVHVGSLMHFQVKSAIPGQLLLYNVDLASGTAYQIFPNKYSASSGNSALVETSFAIIVPSNADGFNFRAKAPIGRNRLYAFVLPQETRIAGIASRGMDMNDLPNAAHLFLEIRDLAQRGVGIEGKEHAKQGATYFDYEIIE